MLIIEIGNKQYEVPQEWRDITLKKYCDSVSLLQLMPKKLHAITFGSAEERAAVEVSDEDSLLFAAFYKKWVSFFCEIPETITGQLPVEAPDGVGVINLYLILTKFMIAPADGEVVESAVFDFNGKTYTMPEGANMLNGGGQPMAKESFDAFYEGVELKRIQSEIKNGNAHIMPLLTAIIYRPAIAKRNWFGKIKGYEIEPYDSSKTALRAKDFESLPMDKAWGAYFFFIRSKLLLFKGTLTSLKEAEPAYLDFGDSAGI